MSGAGNPLGYDYRDPHHVERYGKLVVRNPDGSTEGKHPRDADVDVMREIHDPAPLLRVIRVKCIDCSGGSESEARKCTAIGCALWPYRMASNPFHAPREMTPEQRGRPAPPGWPPQGRAGSNLQEWPLPSPSIQIIKAKTSRLLIRVHAHRSAFAFMSRSGICMYCPVSNFAQTQLDPPLTLSTESA